MSFNTITITRSYPIVNGFVQLPNNLEMNKSAISVEAALLSDPSLSLVRMTAQSGGARLAGGKHGLQEWLNLLPETVGCCSTCCSDSSAESEILKGRQPVPPDDPPPPGEAEWNRNPPCDINCEALANVAFNVSWVGSIERQCCGEAMQLQGQALISNGQCSWVEAFPGPLQVTLQLYNDGGYCYYVLNIYCAATQVLIYSGIYDPIENPDHTPAGYYTKTGGCSDIEVQVNIGIV